VSVIRQLSLFGIEASAPRPADLAGLLFAGGVIRTSDGVEAGPPAAQIEIVVGQPWRSAAIVAECARRGVAATSVAAVSAHVGVRTAFSTALLPLARDWADELGRREPTGMRLGAATLRLWAVAAGFVDASAYVLPIAVTDLTFRDAVGAALARLGVVAQLVSPRGGTLPTYRIVGRRRMARLVELVGDPPKQAPADIWPS
jgi:hypothetical protein